MKVAVAAAPDTISRVGRRVYTDVDRSIDELQRWLRKVRASGPSPGEAELVTLEVVDGSLFDAVLAVRRCDRRVR